MGDVLAERSKSLLDGRNKMYKTVMWGAAVACPCQGGFLLGWHMVSDPPHDKLIVRRVGACRWMGVQAKESKSSYFECGCNKRKRQKQGAWRSRVCLPRWISGRAAGQRCSGDAGVKRDGGRGGAGQQLVPAVPSLPSKEEERVCTCCPVTLPGCATHSQLKV